ncbi:hypothetical protein [Paraburkholderia sp. RL17-337-BIB-A]|uniref:hypothetical protein n=1 Tax=Paraburkholderia sp. RL17-337-BIB-A TaxID=3031636 RepID=UPI0038B93286
MKSKNTVAVALILLVVAFSGDANAKLKAASERDEIEVQTCKVSIAPNARGEIMKPRKENNYKFAGYSETFESKGISQRFGLSIGCVDRITNRNDVAKEHGGYFDSGKKTWVAYYVDEQDKDSLAPATHIYAIHTSNASGFARTTDDVIGDPRQRARALSYCLFHDAKAICGEGQVMNLSDQRANFLPTALKILRSVEFVDVKPNDRSALGATGTVAPVGKSTR